MIQSCSPIRVDLGERSYDIAISSGESARLGDFVRGRAQGNLALLVTDENAKPHAETAQRSMAAAGFRTALVSFPAGEEQKSLPNVSMLYDRLADLRADRKSLVIAVGGGVIGDLAGFAAATFNRGVQLLMMPTTLLAMVDSSVGGKVGVNHRRAKNLIGAFHQPLGVWIDTAVLASLPDREYRSGLAEVVKYGVIMDETFFSYLEKQANAILSRDPDPLRYVVGRCCRLKADVVEQDEREETGLRMILNYGHTFAHAFETVGGYGAWLHGEAVAAGMICASRLAESKGLIPSGVTERQESLLSRFGLPTRPKKAWPAAGLVEVMHSDKKALAGSLRFVLPRRLGEVAVFEGIPDVEVQQILETAAPV